MSLLEAAAPFDDKVDEASRIGGVDDAGVFLGRMMASAQTGFQGWGECFHRFWLAEEEANRWEGAGAATKGPARHDDTGLRLRDRVDRRRARRVVDAGPRGLGHVAAKHLVLSARPGVGSQLVSGATAGA